MIDDHLREHNNYGDNLYFVETGKFETMLEEVTFQLQRGGGGGECVETENRNFKGRTIENYGN